MFKISPKSEKSVDSYFSLFWEKYCAELIESGVSESAAVQEVKETKNSIFTDDTLNPQNKLFDVINEGIFVGDLWLVAKENGKWWIYDLEITGPNRAQGLGRKTLQEAEIYAKRNGCKELRLSVFGFNDVAKHLYDSLGYQTTRIQMKKDLT